MDDAIAIEVEHVGKRFRLQHRDTKTLKGSALEWLRLHRRSSPAELWALRAVSFSVRRGETLGIIGANGAGKSTLLALLAGTMAPTEGRIESRGVISSLLELGAGFHPDLTGRENIFLCGAILGLSRRQMRARFDAIVEFAGLSRFIDEPVRHYSSGMYVRLGFAVAVEIDPEILLIDEVLAVGDTDFQRKCIARMAEFRKRQKTMLIISHDLPTIQSISDRIIILDAGRILGDGDPSAMVAQYEASWRRRTSADLRREWGTRDVVITQVDVVNQRDEATDVFGWGDTLVARIRYQAARRIESPVFGFALSDREGRVVSGNNTQIEQFTIPYVEGQGTLTVRLPELRLASGTYLLSFSVHSSDHQVNFHRLDNVVAVAVKADREFDGYCYLRCEFAHTAGGQRKGGA